MNLKGYTFNSKEDFVYYIHQLIIGITNTLKRYERQINELGKYIEEKDLIARPKRVVSTDICENYESMLNYTSSYLMNLFGDQANFGMSYQNYRRHVVKKSKELNLDFVTLTEEQKEELNEITTSRDWGSHVPVSLLHSTSHKALNLTVDANNPIKVAEFEKYQGLWLVSLYDVNFRSLEGLKGMFELVKQDYEKLTGNPCRIVIQKYPIRNINDLMIPIISSGIQRKEIKSIEDIQNIYKGEREV
ncbi:hypothetical protein [Oceanobacillus halotolerans]|uniref:hypothetical protein n=1 Tax=Oceanobacillus halotolerans TaxID=2663380 RepID=UPI0013D9C80A|nr:hypothetical protein [Oceanobacillus halotolerans]